MVSIITPFYNAENYLEEAINSVLEQTYAEWELLLIDDTSTDASPKIAKNFAENDPRIHYITLSKNSGTGKARNTGIKAARGNKIAFLDADDRWKPNKLERQILFMKEHNCACCYSSYDLIDETGKPLNKQVKALPQLSFKKLERANYIGNLTGIYDVAQLGKIYAPPMRKRQDWALWLDVIKKAGNAQGISGSLAYYRIRDNSISGNKWKLLRYNYAIYHEHLGYSSLKSCYKMTFFLWEQFAVKPRQVIDYPSR